MRLMQPKVSILRQISVITQTQSQHWFNQLCGTALTVFCLLGLTGASGPVGKPKQVELKIGIVQRFGDKPADQLTLQATQGDRLTVQFLGGNMKPQTMQVNSIKIEIKKKPLPQSEVKEWLVLGNYRSFETAEDSAAQWRQKGIEVEIAQPERWQVWAKRDVYQTPLLRRLLLQSLQTQGDRKAYLDTKVKSEELQISWQVNGLGYNRGELDVTSNKSPIQVSLGKSDRSPRTYAGSLHLQPNAYGTYTLINKVPLETYVRGVVPHEMVGNAPPAANEAQAIIARTYALRNIRRFAVDGYELCADVHCQVYRGLTGTLPNTDRAVTATKGQVLTYQNELVDALYSSTAGGITASFNDVWNGEERPYLKTVVDSPANIWSLSGNGLAKEQNFRKFIGLKEGFNEKGWSTFRWRREADITQITQDLQRYLKRTKSADANFKTIKEMRVVERSNSGRILKLAVQTDRGVIEILKDDVRSAFIPPLSTLFYLEPTYTPDKNLKGYAFVGGGFGHGVGMSQTGAYNLAKRGWSSEKILSFYYPNAQIQPLNPAITFSQEQTAPIQSKK